MESAELMSQEELDAITRKVWEGAKENILKQVEYSILTEMSTRARTRAHSLIIKEVDAILKPKIESMKAAMEERANKIATTLLPRFDKAMEEGMLNAIRSMSSYTVTQILQSAEVSIRTSMEKALEAALNPEKEETA